VVAVRPDQVAESPACRTWVSADNLKRVPDLWIQRSQVAMQFKRVERALEARRNRPGDEHVNRLKARVAEEYAAFRKSVEEWGQGTRPVGYGPQAAPVAALGRGPTSACS